MIPWELCKKLKFDHTGKHKPESLLKIETSKTLSDHLILARRLHRVTAKKKKNDGIHKGENQRKQKQRQVLGPCQRTDNAEEHESDGDISCNWRDWNGPQSRRKTARRIGNQRVNLDHRHYSITEIEQETWEDLQTFAVNEAPLKAYQSKLVWKTCEKLNNSKDS